MKIPRGRCLVATGTAIALWLPAVVSGSRTEDGQRPADQVCVQELVAAYEALDSGDAEGALQRYRTALGMAVSETLRFQALLGLGSTYAALGQPEQALANLERARDLEPDNGRAWYTLGTVYAAVGRTDQALEALTEAGRIEPGLAVAHYDRCVLLEGLGRHADAAEACVAATSAEPDLVEAWVGLGVAHYHLAAYADAAAAFRRALEVDSDSARARFGLGLALLYADDTRGAKEQYLALKTLDAVLAQQLYERIFP
jgi:tetratricopeptide (TPR) repeat protein